MAHYLHIAGGTFELPDEQAATELMGNIERVQKSGSGGRLHVRLKEPGHVVYIFVNTYSAVAISGGPDKAEASPQIY